MGADACVRTYGLQLRGLSHGWPASERSPQVVVTSRRACVFDVSPLSSAWERLCPHMCQCCARFDFDGVSVLFVRKVVPSMSTLPCSRTYRVRPLLLAIMVGVPLCSSVGHFRSLDVMPLPLPTDACVGAPGVNSAAPDMPLWCALARLLLQLSPPLARWVFAGRASNAAVHHRRYVVWAPPGPHHGHAWSMSSRFPLCGECWNFQGFQSARTGSSLVSSVNACFRLGQRSSS